MLRRVGWQPAAVSDLAEAVAYLERVRSGFGALLTGEIQDVIDRIRGNPELYQHIDGTNDARRAVVHRFDYAVVYRVHADFVEVLGVLHSRMSPSRTVNRVASDSH